MELLMKDKKMHHAYCIEAFGTDAVKDVLEFVENKMGFRTKGNPDFWFAEYDTLNVDASRKIRETHFQKPTMGDLRVSVIFTNFITEQAQNAMLKMFEEPTGGTCFFLISPSAGNFLPTLKSRMNFVDIGGKVIMDKNSLSAKEFLSATIADRLKKIKKLLDDISDEKQSKIQVVSFLNNLLSEVRNNTKMSEASKHELFVLEEIEKCRRYASDTSPSLKILLEHLALVI